MEYFGYTTVPAQDGKFQSVIKFDGKTYVRDMRWEKESEAEADARDIYETAMLAVKTRLAAGGYKVKAR